MTALKKLTANPASIQPVTGPRTTGTGFFSNRKRQFGMLVAACALTVVTIVPALAQTDTGDADQTIDQGTLTTSVNSGALFSNITYSHNNQVQSSQVVVGIDDSRGTGAGWALTLSSSDLTGPGGTIPASGFIARGAASVTTHAGQSHTENVSVVDNGNGASLASGATIMTAGADQGMGNYSAVVDVELTIPGVTKAGAYSGTLTVTSNSAPN